MMCFKTRLLIGSSLVPSSRGWRCFPSVGAPRADVWCQCRVCSAQPCPQHAWGSRFEVTPESRAERQCSLQALGLLSVCLPVVSSCFCVDLKLPRTGHIFLLCFEVVQRAPDPSPWALAPSKRWMMFVIAAHWAIQAVTERIFPFKKFPFAFDLE